MSFVEKHHDLSLLLLVGRSLPRGLPWTLADDQVLIARERLLWIQLTQEEREQEQKALAALWEHRGATRLVKVNPEWGEWTVGLPDEVVIPDTAFGMPENSYRPFMKGVQVLVDEHPRLESILRWLWDKGFCPVEYHDETITMQIPPHRVVQESERLVGMFLKNPPAGLSNVTIKSVYDPVIGRAVILMSGVQS